MSCPYLKKSNRSGKVFYMCKILGKGIHLDKKGREDWCNDKKKYFSCPYFVCGEKNSLKSEHKSNKFTLFKKG